MAHCTYIVGSFKRVVSYSHLFKLFDFRSAATARANNKCGDVADLKHVVGVEIRTFDYTCSRICPDEFEVAGHPDINGGTLEAVLEWHEELTDAFFIVVHLLPVFDNLG